MADEKPQSPKSQSKEIDREGWDLGVPMLPGSPDEPQGPEDALGPGPKRGDYTDRLGGPGYLPHQGVEPQKPRAEDIGDEPGVKGGVDTEDKSSS